jgi:hypothetical protein
MVDSKAAKPKISDAPRQQQKLPSNRTVFRYSKRNGIRAMRIEPERVPKKGVFPEYLEIFWVWDNQWRAGDGGHFVEQVEWDVRDIISVVETIEIIHKWIKNNTTMDAITSKILMYELNFIIISIERKWKINININDSRSKIID